MAIFTIQTNRILIAKWQQLMVTARQDQAEQKSDYDRSHRSKCNRIHHTHKKVHSTQWVHKVKTTTASNIKGGKGLSLILCTSWRIKTGTELCRSMTRRDQEEKKLYHQQIIQDTDTGQRIKGRGRRITLQSMSKYSSRSLSLRSLRINTDRDNWFLLFFSLFVPLRCPFISLFYSIPFRLYSIPCPYHIISSSDKINISLKDH